MKGKRGMTTTQNIVGTSPATTKKQLTKIYNAWRRGDVSKREIDRAWGRPSWGGKFVSQLWETRLGVDTSRNALK